MNTYTDQCDMDGHAWDSEYVCTCCGAQAECDVPGCGIDAEPQGTFEDTLCHVHLKEAYESLAADLRHDTDREAAL